MNKIKRQEVEEPQKCRKRMHNLIPCTSFVEKAETICQMRNKFLRQNPAIANAYCPEEAYRTERNKSIVIEYNEWGLGGSRTVCLFRDGKLEVSATRGEKIKISLTSEQASRLVKKPIAEEFLKLPENPDFSNCLDGWSGSIILNWEGHSKKVESENITSVPPWFRRMTDEIENLIDICQSHISQSKKKMAGESNSF